MYRIAKGGAITINSFLNEADRNVAREHMLKTASSNMREAAKIGLQSLYADPKEVLEKYKDFDIVKEMQARKGAKLLWVRARAIDADTINANGDYFSKKELLKEVEIKGEKIPAYKTFEGVPIYTNHKNDDIEQAKGMVVYAEWNEEQDCVYCTFFVDEEAYPDIARNIRTGVIHDVSMGCSVDYGICSKCGNKAFTEKDYCECLKKYKGKTHPETSKKIYEENYNLKFIELSCVGDGAFEACEIQEIYDVDDVLSVAESLEKKANEIVANIVLAYEGAPKTNIERTAYEDCLRVAQSTSLSALRLAQNAGTLVGGPLLAGPGSNQNSTVAAILQALGIDPRSGLNILDLINLSLNFLEVAVMNLFARKDNVDLTHVGKITKGMADLQSVMQDMIDDGVDVGSGQRPQPINQGQTQQATAPVNTQVGLANYAPAGGVGKIMELNSPTQQEQPVGSGVALASSNINFVWASRDGKREVFASTSYNKHEDSSKILKFTKSILSLKQVLGTSEDIQNGIDNVIRIANERNKNIKNNAPIKAEGRNQMDHFAKIAQEQRKKLAAAVTIDFKVEDNSGNRVVLSTDGSIVGYTNGKRTNWEPILSESHINMMESGQGTRVAAELLGEYGKFVKTALLNVKERLNDKQEQLEEVRTGEGYDSKSLQEALSVQHKGYFDKTKEEELESSRTGAGAGDVKEKLLADAGLYAHMVKDLEVKQALSELITSVNLGVPTEVLEKQLAACRTEGSASAHEVMSATINALGKAVVLAKETPKRILKVAQMLSENKMLPEMVGSAAADMPNQMEKDEKASFFKDEEAPVSGASAILKSIAEQVSDSITAKDLVDALSVALDEQEITIEGVTRFAELMLASSPAAEEGLDAQAPVSDKTEELRQALQDSLSQDKNYITKEAVQSAISAMAMSSQETQTAPGEPVEVVDSMTDKELVAAINRAKTASSTDSRLRARERREFWGVKTASAKNLESNVIGWLADYSTNFDIPTTKIALAAKRLAEDYELAEKLVAKAIETKQNLEKTAGMSVTHHKSDCLTFMCTKEDLNGMDPADTGFEDSFKQKAIEVLQSNNFQVDPGTFSFTNLTVSSSGQITATVSTSVSKSFDVDGVETESDVDVVVDAGEELPVVMTESAKFARRAKREEVLRKYAQAAPGVAPAGPAAGAVDPMAGMMAPAAEDPGALGLTGMPAEVGDMGDMDAISEPGQKKPWGSVCPVCGSDDVNISEGNADCQSCGSNYKILQSLELISEGDKGKAMDESGDMGLGANMGLGAATAPAETTPATQGAPPGVAGGMAPMASARAMFRLATTVDSDVYLRTAMPDFDKGNEKRLPVGMICPSCGSREAHKVKNNTFCYKCGTYAKTKIASNKANPSKLDVTITWID